MMRYRNLPRRVRKIRLLAPRQLIGGVSGKELSSSSGGGTLDRGDAVLRRRTARLQGMRSRLLQGLIEAQLLLRLSHVRDDRLQLFSMPAPIPPDLRIGDE